MELSGVGDINYVMETTLLLNYLVTFANLSTFLEFIAQLCAAIWPPKRPFTSKIHLVSHQLCLWLWATCWPAENTPEGKYLAMNSSVVAWQGTMKRNFCPPSLSSLSFSLCLFLIFPHTVRAGTSLSLRKQLTLTSFSKFYFVVFENY